MLRVFAHRRMRRAVDAYLDGELALDARYDVARHLSVCWECSITAETVRLVKRALAQRRARTPVSIAERRLRRLAEDLARAGLPDRADDR